MDSLGIQRRFINHWIQVQQTSIRISLYIHTRQVWYNFFKVTLGKDKLYNQIDINVDIYVGNFQYRSELLVKIKSVVFWSDLYISVSY